MKNSLQKLSKEVQSLEKSLSKNNLHPSMRKAMRVCLENKKKEIDNEVERIRIERNKLG